MLKQRKHDDDDDFDERGVLKEGRQMRVLDAPTAGRREALGRLHDGSGNHQLIHHMPGFIVSDSFRPKSASASATRTISIGATSLRRGSRRRRLARPG